MKKKLLLLLIAVYSLCNTNLFAEKKWNIGLGYGGINSDLTSQMGLIGGVIYENGDMFYVTVKRSLSRQKVYVSLSGIANQNKGEFMVMYPPFSEYNYSLFQFGLLAGAGFDWYQSTWLTFSSDLNIGFNHYQLTKEAYQEPNKTKFVYHINACRLRVGKQLGGYLQIGYGIKGIVGLGIDFRF